MNTIITILLIVAGIIALLLIIALFIKKEHYVKREIIINAPLQKVFDFLKLLKNQDQFNKWATVDKKNRNEEFSYGGPFNTEDKFKTASVTIRMEYLLQ